MANNSEVKLDEQTEMKNKVTPLKIDLDLGIDKIVTDLKTVQREAKKATQAIKEMEFMRDNLHETDDVTALLRLADKYGLLLVPTCEDKSRGIGKTHSLVKKAIKENLVILEPFNSQVEYVKNKFHFDGVINVNGYQGGSNMLKYAKGFLVDDMVSTESIEEFMKSNPHLPFKGGFLKDSISVRLNKLQMTEEY